MGSRRDLRAVSAERARFLLAHPAYDGFSAVADIAAELDVRDAAAPRMLTHPADRDAEQLGDVCGGEEAIAHVESKEAD
jgi:hypothetical protein